MIHVPDNDRRHLEARLRRAAAASRPAFSESLHARICARLAERQADEPPALAGRRGTSRQPRFQNRHGWVVATVATLLLTIASGRLVFTGGEPQERSLAQPAHAVAPLATAANLRDEEDGPLRLASTPPGEDAWADDWEGLILVDWVDVAAETPVTGAASAALQTDKDTLDLAKSLENLWALTHCLARPDDAAGGASGELEWVALAEL